MKHYLIGIAGGTGSGKTTIAKKILEKFNEQIVTIIKYDDYYKDQSHLSFHERLLTNYDHPRQINNELLFNDLKLLLNNNPINKPKYDFSSHTLLNDVDLIMPTKIIILEGIFALEDCNIRSLMNLKIYVDTDDDIRLIRRITRDMAERGRDYDSIILQYIDTVKPMHNQFVEPSKKYANIIIPEGGNNEAAINLIISTINHIILVPDYYKI